MYDIGMINAAIGMYFNTLKRYNKTLYNNLSKGLSDKEINDFESQLDFKLPPEIFSLYSIKNGLKPKSTLTLDQSLLLDNGLFLSLEQGVGEYNSGLKLIPELKKKLPLFDSGGGDFLLIDCDPASSLYRKILIWAPPLEIVEPLTIYNSLAELFLTTVRCLTTNVYQYDINGNLEIDFEQLKAVALSSNLNVEYWKKV
jgi:hypothetical protein